MHHTEVDDLGAVILHYQNVARLQVAVDQSSLVRGLQSPAHMGCNFYHALHGQAGAGVGDQIGQRGSAQQWHHKERRLPTVFFKEIHIPNFYDIRVRDLGEGSPFFREQIDRHRIGHILHEFDGDRTTSLNVKGAPDHAHTAFTELSLKFVPPRYKRRRHKLFAGQYIRVRVSIRIWGGRRRSVSGILGRLGRSNQTAFLGARLKGWGSTPSTDNIHRSEREHHRKREP